jgi:hypothetical protein
MSEALKVLLHTVTANTGNYWTDLSQYIDAYLDFIRVFTAYNTLPETDYATLSYIIDNLIAEKYRVNGYTYTYVAGDVYD